MSLEIIKSKKYILFDLDGTLTDPKEGITKCFQYSLRKFGIDMECDDLVPCIGPPLKESFTKMFGFDEENTELAIKYYRERFDKVGKFENGVFENVFDVLAKLKQEGKVLAIATSKPIKFTLQICEHYGLSKYFDAIVGCEMDGKDTTKADIIAQVMEELNISPEDAIMIGDRKYDIIGAKTNNMQSIGVTFGYAGENELEDVGADFIIDDIRELI